MRIKNNGIKPVQVGRGVSIAPGHEYECSKALGEQIMFACTFVDEVKTGGEKVDAKTTEKNAESKPGKKKKGIQSAAEEKVGEMGKTTEEQRSLL